ncbi:MAG: hypothetical protein JWR27_2566 [Aeromicrobium sp.]|nr:hypothetical protein [Aeromicrobium sp.]
MGKAVVVVLGIVLFVYAVFDLLATPAAQVKVLPKIAWFVVVLVPVGGPLLWIYWGHAKDAPPKPRKPGGPTPPPGPLGPDDDPDYLRGL